MPHGNRHWDSRPIWSAIAADQARGRPCALQVRMLDLLDSHVTRELVAAWNARTRPTAPVAT